MKLWTVSPDYYATGEGRSLLAWIGYADGERAVLERFGQSFDPFYARGADAAEGLVEDAVVRLLLGSGALEDVRRLNGRENLELHGRLHFNRA
jgi:hypothetical protein